MKRLIPDKPEIKYRKGLEFEREYDLEHFRERLYVHYDILSKCNLSCSYCYAKKDYGSNWGKIPNLKDQIFILKNLSHSIYPVFLGFLGGEPSIHPHLRELSEVVYSDILKNPDSRFYITTNGVKPCDISFHENTFILMSLHPEFKRVYGDGFKRFFDNLERYCDMGFKVRVNQMLSPDEKFYDDYIQIFEKLERYQYPRLSIHPHFLYHNQQDRTSMYEYPEEFWDEFSRFKEVKGNFIFETKDGFCNLNDYIIFRDNLNNFKGWNCYQNNFEISFDGKVSNLCQKKETNLLENPLFFRKLRLKEMKCPYESCVCDGLLKVEKWK